MLQMVVLHAHSPNASARVGVRNAQRTQRGRLACAAPLGGPLPVQVWMALAQEAGVPDEDLGPIRAMAHVARLAIEQGPGVLVLGDANPTSPLQYKEDRGGLSGDAGDGAGPSSSSPPHTDPGLSTASTSAAAAAPTYQPHHVHSNQGQDPLGSMAPMQTTVTATTEAGFASPHAADAAPGAGAGGVHGLGADMGDWNPFGAPPGAEGGAGVKVRGYGAGEGEEGGSLLGGPL